MLQCACQLNAEARGVPNSAKLAHYGGEMKVRKFSKVWHCNLNKNYAVVQLCYCFATAALPKNWWAIIVRVFVQS